MESAQPIQCHIKAPIFVEVGPYKSESRSGCCIIDVTFPNLFYVEIGEIQFKNYYTAFLSIQAKCKDSQYVDGASTWKQCVRQLKLMPDAHCEEGSEHVYTLNSSQLGGIIQHATALRFILLQPSPVWRDYRVENIMLYKQSSEVPKELSVPFDIEEMQKPLAGKEEDMKIRGITSIREVSQRLQPMWALAYQASKHRTPPSIGRYDIDGVYQINLLSLT